MTTPIITTTTPTQTTTTLATATTPATNQWLCTDSSSVDCTVPGLCDINFGNVYCPRTCNSCESAETTTPSPICEDNLIDMVFKCTNLPDICIPMNATLVLCPPPVGYCN
ncbi:uncharacterized protein LOC112561618 [Pomacea canaliculata]|uniref:uncharacterized protein LOC112561618 n=1 Tax=Pomacea canaliculata TaxID=400727 RepID=UPI000D738F7F|nr:uncharacterized protein LOC112561618 [Pomacea canaliculata]